MSTEPASEAQPHDPGERSPAALLAQLQQQIAEATAAAAIAEGRDPAEAMKTSAVEELLAERAAEAAAEQEADAALSPAMSPQEFLVHLAELDRRATEEEGIKIDGTGQASEGPLALCQRYAAGDLARPDLVEALVVYPYAEVERDPYDDVTPDPPGAWSEVEHAHGLGYIDIGIYDEVFRRRHPDYEETQP